MIFYPFFLEELKVMFVLFKIDFKNISKGEVFFVAYFILFSNNLINPCMYNA